MTITMGNNALSDCHSIEQVAELINDEMSTDATAEMIAAAWAIDAIESSDYSDDFSKLMIEAHLEFLIEAGALFDLSDAIEKAYTEKKH